MNEDPRPLEAPAPDNPETKVTEPHFDVISIAIAQPVQPLATTADRPSRFDAIWRYGFITTILLIAIGVVSLATLALGVAGLRHRFQAEQTEAAIKPAEPPSQTAVENQTIEKNSAQRSTSRRINTRTNSNQGKPAARKVGVIVYGRSSDN